MRAELTGWEVAPSAEGPWAGVTLAHRGSDAADSWFRVRFVGSGELRLDGLATLCEAWLDGVSVVQSESMYSRHVVGGVGEGEHELVVVARALTERLAERRKPRQRWRTAVVADAGIRFLRTSLFGRAPGFAPDRPVVGPWRAVTLGPPQPDVRVLPRLEGPDGVLAVRAPGAARVELDGPSGAWATALSPLGGELRVPGVATWWPHTHGAPARHRVRVLDAAGDVLAERWVGFRALEASGGDPVEDGLTLRVGGVDVFARGAVWTPVAVGEVRPTLERLRDAGCNLVRLPGTGAYESDAFFDACDELGLLVWHDLPFANLDYPFSDDAFRAGVEAEVEAELAAVAGRPCLAVVCGNSEVEQQVAMLGLDPALGRGELYGKRFEAILRLLGSDAIYVPSAPCGGALPFRSDAGIASYFGVGGYRRPLEDARRAEVRFAAECLPFANVGEAPLPALGGEAWRAGVPRDPGADWDFDDVRDAYLAELHGVDPAALREADLEHYLERSRLVSGEAMAATLGEWRRRGSPCMGAVILWLRDVAPGAGWGLLDCAGRPKAAYHHVTRALAPVATWLVNEGLGGMRVHVANDGPQPLRVTLRIALHAEGERRVGAAERAIELPAHGAFEADVEALLGHFADVTWAYRFGPPAQDVVFAWLEGEDGGVLSRSVCFPTGPPLERESFDALGLSGERHDGAVVLRTRRLAYGVRVRVPGFEPADDAFTLAPGEERVVALREVDGGGGGGGGARGDGGGGALEACNLLGRVALG